jgi:hypothetical protein
MQFANGTGSWRMKLKPLYSILAVIIVMAVPALFGVWFGYSIEKPVPTAEQQMMNLQTYIGVEADGCFGPLTQKA